MGKKGKNVEQEIAHDEIYDKLEAINARSMMIESGLDMGWKLAVAFLTPIIGGIWIDKYFDSSPSVTITGFMIAAVASSMVVYTAVKEANRKVANDTDETNENSLKNSK